MLFDFSTMAVGEQIRAQKDTTIDFIHNQLKPADLVCVMSATTGPLEITQDFTDDKDALEAAVKKFPHWRRVPTWWTTSEPATPRTTTQFSPDQSEFDIFTTLIRS